MFQSRAVCAPATDAGAGGVASPAAKQPCVPHTSADSSAAGVQTGHRTVVVVGDGDLGEETARALEASGARVSLLREPSESSVRDELSGGVDSVAIVAR